jgi:hypothetical protein
MHYTVPDLRLRCFCPEDFKNGKLANTQFTGNDVIQIPSVYCIETYGTLLEELETANEASNNKLLIPWHKANHLIANDKHRAGAWKEECPTFKAIIDDIATGFRVTPNATRVNIYRSGEAGRWGNSESKPMHHDRSAKVGGLSQNITIGVSLGASRELAFKHTKRKKSPDDKWYNIKSGAIISTVCDSGSIYAFSRDVNVEFQHGVLPSHGQFGSNEDIDRISIIVWGTRYDMDVSDSRVTTNNIPTARELGVKESKRRYKSTN